MNHEFVILNKEKYEAGYDSIDHFVIHFVSLIKHVHSFLINFDGSYKVVRESWEKNDKLNIYLLITMKLGTLNSVSKYNKIYINHIYSSSKYENRLYESNQS